MQISAKYKICQIDKKMKYAILYADKTANKKCQKKKDMIFSMSGTN